MLKTMTPEVHRKLSEIGFEQDEIALFAIIHQFKEQQLLHDVQELIREYSFNRMMSAAAKTWDEKQWDEEQLFDLVEQYRKGKKSNEGGH